MLPIHRDKDGFEYPQIDDKSVCVVINTLKVLKTNDTWDGMTYHEDVVAVKDSLKKMLENGVYKADLFSDL